MLEHPFVRENVIEEREFQTTIADEAAGKSSLVVLPTGLGKTVIACLVIAKKLRRGGRALVLAPTRPLANQHANSIRRFLTLGSPICLTGQVPKKKRTTLWNISNIVVATPQVAVNDLNAGMIPNNIVLTVFDEAHRAVGNYAYVPLAKGLRELCPGMLVLGLTASPGHEIERIEEVTRSLGIENLIMRTREDVDVAPYVQEVSIDWVEVPPSEIMKKISKYLTKYLHEQLNALRRYGFLRNRKNIHVRIQDLTDVRKQMAVRSKGGKFPPYLFQASRRLSLAQVANHAILCIERQGVDSFLKFLEPKTREGRSKYDAAFMKDARVQRAYNAAKKWKGPSHPKIEPMLATIRNQLWLKPTSKIIVFAELRDTVYHIVGLLENIGVSVKRFVGQGTREGRKGMTQKQQVKTLARFEGGNFNVMVATSIAEEGLDVPQVDLVIFYEPVASDIRLIQRKGRTGRDAKGRVVILTTDRSADERYLWAGIKKERRMKRLVDRIASATHKGEASLDEQVSETDPEKTWRPRPKQPTLDDFL
ncbi:MAG: DEAD/DEAH box helicase [Thermoplasmata archaeon]